MCRLSQSTTEGMIGTYNLINSILFNRIENHFFVFNQVVCHHTQKGSLLFNMFPIQ